MHLNNVYISRLERSDVCSKDVVRESDENLYHNIYLNIIHFMLCSVRYKTIHQRLLRIVRVMLNECAMCLN